MVLNSKELCLTCKIKDKCSQREFAQRKNLTITECMYHKNIDIEPLYIDVTEYTLTLECTHYKYPNFTGETVNDHRPIKVRVTITENDERTKGEILDELLLKIKSGLNVDMRGKE